MSSHHLGAIVIAAMLVPLVMSCASVPSDVPVKVSLRILETTDLHMNLEDYDYYQDRPTEQLGLARTVTLIKAARAEATNSLLFDNGDLLQGTPMGDLVARIQPLAGDQVHPAYRVMNKLGYDAGNIGNHDFNYGLPFLRQAQSGAAFPIVDANVYLDDAQKDTPAAHHAFTPYVLLDRDLIDEQGRRHTLRIGVIGFAPPQIMLWDTINLTGRVVVHDIVETAAALVPEMRAKGAQLVVAIPHSGFEREWAGPGAENSVGKLSTVPGIDAILFGHSHAVFPSADFANREHVDLERGTINGAPSVMPGKFGDHLGIIDLQLEVAAGRWRVVDSRASTRAIYDDKTRHSLAASDPLVEQTIGDVHARTLAYVRGHVAETAVPLYSYFAQVGDDASVQLVADAQADYLKHEIQGTDYEQLPVLSAAAPFKIGGRQGWDFFTDVPAGPMAMRHMADLYVYPNTVTAMVLTGAQVREWLEMSAGQFRRIDPKGPSHQPLLDDRFVSFNFDTIEGVRYEFDVTQPARYGTTGELINPDSHRVVGLTFQGRPIDPAQRFIVATNNYRAFGGGHFPALDASTVAFSAPDENRQVLVDYVTRLAAQSPDHRIAPVADGNWRVRPVPGITMTFVSGRGGIAYLSRHPAIRLVEERPDGSALYELAN